MRFAICEWCGAHDVSRLMDSYSKHDYFDGPSLIMSIYIYVYEMKSEIKDENTVRLANLYIYIVHNTHTTSTTFYIQNACHA